MLDPDIAQLARGVQDCARALTCLADRLDGLERRLDACGEAGAIDARVRALEAASAEQVRGVDQRLRRLEVIPASVARLQQDTAWLADLATTRRVEEAATRRTATPAELAPVYQELDTVAALVVSQQAAATQSLERVRALERAVLDMRRQLERNMAGPTRPSPAPPQGDPGA